MYGVIKRGPKDKRIDYTPMQIFGEKAKDLKPRGIGVLDPKLHKKHYNAVADAVLLHKLGDRYNRKSVSIIRRRCRIFWKGSQRFIRSYSNRIFIQTSKI